MLNVCLKVIFKPQNGGRVTNADRTLRGIVSVRLDVAQLTGLGLMGRIMRGHNQGTSIVVYVNQHACIGCITRRTDHRL